MVLPYLTDEADKTDLDSELLCLDFPEFAFSGAKFDFQIWGFANAKVCVEKMKLEGPVSLGVSYVQDANDVYAPGRWDRAAEHVERVEASNKGLQYLKELKSAARSWPGASPGRNKQRNASGHAAGGEKEDLSDQDASDEDGSDPSSASESEEE